MVTGVVVRLGEELSIPAKDWACCRCEKKYFYDGGEYFESYQEDIWIERLKTSVTWCCVPCAYDQGLLW